MIGRCSSKIDERTRVGADKSAPYDTNADHDYTDLKPRPKKSAESVKIRV
ncbi:MAG: hypothetical protein FWG87_08355 [Defluviitaleaceae bacterium]|nr:hypothetical protein [Defluviitaleaceae bacterium]